MSYPENFPRMAVMLPHPEQEQTYAVDARTGTLPGLQLDVVDALTDEQVALQFAASLNHNPDHSVNRTIRVYPGLALFVLQKPAYPELAPPFTWLDCRIETVRRQLGATITDEVRKMSQDHRDLLIQRGMKVLSIFTIAHALGGPNIHEIVRSFLYEEPGMYNLPLFSELTEVSAAI